jgi:HAD superfamily hydrolase (TIGR01509 family)
MTIKTIFFDNDGVLVDTEIIYFEANRAILRERLGVELSLETFKDVCLVRGAGFMEIAGDRAGGPENIERLRAERDDRYSELLEDRAGSLLMEGVAETIGKLRGSYKMGIVTSCQKPHFEIIHRGNGFLDNFDFIVAHGDFARSKPWPDPYLRALGISGAAPEECLVVEDSARGLLAAAAAGLDCAVIPTSLTAGADFSKARVILPHIRELLNILPVPAA